MISPAMMSVVDARRWAEACARLNAYNCLLLFRFGWSTEDARLALEDAATALDAVESAAERREDFEQPLRRAERALEAVRRTVLDDGSEHAEVM